MEEEKQEPEVLNVEENTVPATEEQNAWNEALTSSQEPEEKPKTKHKALKIIIILLVLALIACGVCWYLGLFNQKPTKQSTKKKEVYSKYRLSGNDLEDFDLYFLQLENEEKNKVYSPLSIKYALEMLGEGASGESKTQIDNIIGKYKAKKYPNSENMSFANAMFIKDTFKDKVKEKYTNNLKEKYYAEVITDPFASPDNINNWVSDKTFKLIDNLLDDVSNNNFFLINALAIDMNWNNQIHCATGSKVPCFNERGIYSIGYAHERISDDARTAYRVTSYPYSIDEEFYHLDFNGKEKSKASAVLADYNRYDIIKELGEESIRATVTEEYKKWLETDEGKATVRDYPESANVEKYIDGYIDSLKENYGKANNSTDFMLYTDDDVIAFAKDLKEYDGTTLQYVGIMPKEEDLKDYIADLTAKDVNKVISNLKELKIENFKEGVATIIRGDIPLFKYEYELSLMEDLKKLGIEDVFDNEKADLSNMVDTKGSYIDQAIHKANIEFSNDGIKAAAATAMGGYGATSGGFEYLYTIPVEEIDLTFDKPYMYIIRDKDSGEVWFAGTVYEGITK